VIKQFNFYDIYGYLLPGMLLLGVLWAPVGLITHLPPSKDLSDTVLVAALAYIAGHLVRVVSASVVPSTIIDSRLQRRVMSDYLLDKSNTDAKWAPNFKVCLQRQVQELFNISLELDKDGDGANEISKNRNTAFFQARSYLIAKDSAAYVEQFEGMYSMMRGLGCCFYVGAVYFAGWWISFYSKNDWVVWGMAAVTLLGVVGTLWFSLRPKLTTPRQKLAAIWMWLLSFYGVGFWMGVGSANHFKHSPNPNVRLLLVGAAVMMVIAAIKCFSAYREFARVFAETVWRDFSACVAYGPKIAAKVGPGESD